MMKLESYQRLKLSKYMPYAPLVVILMVAGMQIAQAQNHASASANVSARIVQGILMTKINNLRFGALQPGALGGTVTVDTNNQRTATGSITLLTSTSFPIMAASFTMLGAPNLVYTITLPSSATLTKQGGSEIVIVNGFTSNPSTSSTLNSTGNGTLSVGGSLFVAAGQAEGTYSGSFSVILNYQ